MSTPNLTDIAAKTLGSSASYAVYTEQFDPTLLNPMPRELARDHWGITGREFVGFDTWHCHEATFLLNNGFPIAGTLKYNYPADSKNMVESKSAKLYLNSFDMCKMGETVKDAIINYENQVKKDLEEALGTIVNVCFFPSGSELNGYDAVEDYKDLHWELREKAHEITITDYSAQEDHLKFVKMHSNVDAPVTSKWFTNALRSRCRHTKQKDTGAAYIYIKSKNGMAVDPESLFKQIVSLREVNEFHEFCAEKLFVTIMAHEEVEDCCVTLLYSRRGSLDINPVRASNVKLLPEVLFNVSKFTNKAQGQ